MSRNECHYRLFCLLDTQAPGLGPLLVVIAGADKPFRAALSEDVYAAVRTLGAWADPTR